MWNRCYGGESALSSEGTEVMSLEHGTKCSGWQAGRTNCAVSGGTVQAIGCTVMVPGWNAACKGRQVFGKINDAEVDQLMLQ